MAASDSVYISTLSRFQRTDLFQDTNGNLFWDVWGKVSFEPRNDDRFIVVKELNKGMRVDRLAHEMYNDSSLWWAICEANGIINPFEELTDSSTKAKSGTVLSADNRQCFVATANFPGARHNTGDYDGISFVTHPTGLDVYVRGKLRESFTDLSPYPETLTGEVNTNFWGSLKSSVLTITWVSTYTLQPELSGGIGAPVPQEGKEYHMTGGVDTLSRTLRIPSIAHINEKLAL